MTPHASNASTSNIQRRIHPALAVLSTDPWLSVVVNLTVMLHLVVELLYNYITTSTTLHLRVNAFFSSSSIDRIASSRKNHMQCITSHWQAVQ